MNRKIVFAFLALLFALPFVGAQTETKLVAKPISRIHLVGTGIAINSTDPMDFMHAKAIIGAVRIRQHDNNFAVKRLGVLILDNTVYHLKNIAVSLDEISAEVFEKGDVNSIGKMYVARYEKPGRDIWAGELSLDNSLYNVYFLGLKRQFKPLEAAEKIGEYCKEHPSDEHCQSIVAQCLQNPRACKAKVVSYCKEHPDDAKCIAAKKLYCLKNASDVRCREFLLKTCRENPNAPYCKVQKIKNSVIAAINPERVEAITTEAGESIKAISKPIFAVRNRWKKHWTVQKQEQQGNGQVLPSPPGFDNGVESD